MLKITTADPGKIISFTKHALVWIRSGQGLVEVDFKTFSDLENRIVFLSPGQAMRIVAGQFEVAILEFSESLVSRSQDYRVLFKHLVSLGYIEFSERKQAALEGLVGDSPGQILDISTHQWYWQNPFQANRDEYTVIFDLKDVIDTHFAERWSVDQFVSNIDHAYFSVHRLVKERVGLSIKGLAQRKLLVESQRAIAFTDKPVQEIAFDMGFKDPAYFNRFFKQHTGLTPLEFRARMGHTSPNALLEDLVSLIQSHHGAHRTAAFYADKLNVSIKTLSRRVKDRLQVTVGELIRREVLVAAKRMLGEEGRKVKETAYALGFLEANHFSAFFKKHTGLSPSEFQSKKSNH